MKHTVEADRVVGPELLSGLVVRGTHTRCKYDGGVPGPARTLKIDGRTGLLTETRFR